MSEFLRSLRREVEAHEGVNHLFLQRLAVSPFAREDYRVFGENHFPLVCVFTNYLERLLLRAPNSESKLWLAKVLVDEYGEGSEGHDHAELYADFLRSAGSPVPDRIENSTVPGPAHAFVREHRRIVGEEPFLVGLGAVGPGHEWAIPKMFAAIIPGLRRAGFSEHEMRYFTLHCEQDIDHGTWLEHALERFGSTAQARAEIRRGALLSLQARARFWSGVQAAIVRYRQPKAVRSDGKRPRSTLGELSLFAWDALPLGDWARRGRAAYEARTQPKLQALVESGRR